MRVRRLLITCSLLASCSLLACRPGAAELRAARSSEASTRLDRSELPGDWDGCSRSLFELALASWEPRALGDADLEALRAGLDVEGQVSVRAALLLAHAAEGPTGSRALPPLLDRLEARHSFSARALDAGDVVAAAALAAHPLTPQQLDSLVELAIGETHHPDLEVRVECAATALRRSREQAVAFLLRVLRAMTPDEALDPPDWPRKATMAWAKSRAAEALSEAAGVPCSFVPDASFADQMLAADALARHWGR